MTADLSTPDGPDEASHEETCTCEERIVVNDADEPLDTDDANVADMRAEYEAKYAGCWWETSND